MMKSSEKHVAPGGEVSARRFRLRGLAVLLPCLAVLGVSAWLTPDPRGVGTHEQLGLGTCSMLIDRGWPCPGCGLTTAFASTANGQLVAAFQAQAAGPILLAAVVLLAVAAAVELATGRDQLRRFRPGWWCVIAPILVILIGWGIKAYIGWKTGMYPLR
ncbi:MAG: DUF2752 domain-containing protein [Phycisphaerae bacterium]|nr:DUF2752 domain-containing protein [Phycisphaerae bacterium]